MIKKIGLALLIGALSSTAVANKALDDLRAGSKSDVESEGFILTPKNLILVSLPDYLPHLMSMATEN
jgi:hypothetical protein